MLRFRWLVLAAWVGLGATAQAQSQQLCNDSGVSVSSPTSRFVSEDDGTAVDQLTQLMWMRCPLGQAWTGQSCQGEAMRLNWQDGAAAAERLNRSGSHFYNDWRVPSLRELATVAERRCTRPRINLQIFPGTPAAAFWTSTASLQDRGQAYSLDFDAGGIRQAAHDAALHVRLVRSAP
jgi:hypothetical protein